LRPFLVGATMAIMKIAGFAWVLVACIGCGSSAAPTGVSAAVPSQGYPVIGRLRTRDRMVLLLASGNGLRVTIEDLSGAVLAEEVPLEAVRDRDPVTYVLCTSALASRAPTADARLDLPPQSAEWERAR
jgi:hypothetical protein